MAQRVAAKYHVELPLCERAETAADKLPAVFAFHQRKDLGHMRIVLEDFSRTRRSEIRPLALREISAQCWQRARPIEYGAYVRVTDDPAARPLRPRLTLTTRTNARA